MTAVDHYLKAQNRLHQKSAGIPDDMHDFYHSPSPPKSGEADREIAWLRGKIRRDVLQDAVFHAFGDTENAPTALNLVMAVRQRLNWPLTHAQAAFNAEKTAATVKAADLLRAVENRVRTLANERTPGARMIDEAQRIVSAKEGDHYAWVSDECIVSLCQRIALATVRTSRARRAG